MTATSFTADIGRGSHVGCVEALSSDDEDGDVRFVSDHLAVNWQVQCRQQPGALPGQSLTSILQWLCAAEHFENRPVTVSDVERVFILVGLGDFAFPFQLDGSTNWQLKQLAALFQKPTLAMLLGPLQQALQIYSLFPDALLRTPSQPAKELGLYMPMKGLRACLPALHSLPCTAGRSVSALQYTLYYIYIYIIIVNNRCFISQHFDAFCIFLRLHHVVLNSKCLSIQSEACQETVLHHLLHRKPIKHSHHQAWNVCCKTCVL